MTAPTRAAALAELRRAFANLESADLDARFLLLHALSISQTELLARPDLPLSFQEMEQIDIYQRRRIAGEPVARILGEWEFWGLPFALNEETLVPRPDTETIVEAALRLSGKARKQPFRILDLGTGSGCLLIALLHELPQAHGLGTDRSFAALTAARANARRNRVGARASFALSNWAQAVTGGFDLVVSNPPYITSKAIPTLPREVALHDPLAALDGGEDGLEAYRTILRDAQRIVRPGGHILVELGYDQKDSVSRLCRAPLAILEVVPDLAGISRCLVMEHKSTV